VKITMSGMKATDRVLDLGALNILSAPNGTGKSALADALRFLALGHVPALGRTPSATAALMRGSDLAVTVTLDDGRTVERTLSRTAAGTYRTGVACSWLAKAKASEHEAEVLRLFGREEADVAEALDIRQLLSATPQQRAARIATLLEAGRSSATSRLEGIGRGMIARLVNLPEERLPKDSGAAFELVAEPQQEAWGEIRATVKARVEAGLENAIAWANEEKRRAADGVQKRIQAKAEIERRLASLPAAAGDVKALEAERTRLEQQIGGARERLAEAGRKVAMIASARGEVAGRKAQLAEAVAAIRKAQLDAGDVSDAALAEVQGKLDNFKFGPTETIFAAKLKAARDKAAAVEEKAKRMPPRPELPSQAEETARVEDLERQFKAATDSPWAEIGVIGKALAKSTTETTKKHGMRLQALARKWGGADPEEIGAALDKASKALEAKHAAVEKAMLAEKKYEDDLARLKAEQVAADAAVDDLVDVIEKKRLDQQAAIEVERAKLIKTRDAIALSLDRITSAATARDHARHALEHAERRVAELGAAPEAVADDTPALAASLVKVQSSLASLGAAGAVKAELASIAREIEREEALRQVCAAVEYSLQRSREQEITDAGGPLLSIMGTSLAAAGRKEAAYFRASKSAVEIGWRHGDGTEVSVASMSGGEYVLFAAALTAATIILRGAPLRVLLVEAGETDDTNLRALLRGIEAVADRLSTVIVSTQQPVEVAPGWNVVTLDRTVAEVAEASA